MVMSDPMAATAQQMKRRPARAGHWLGRVEVAGLEGICVTVWIRMLSDAYAVTKKGGQLCGLSALKGCYMERLAGVLGAFALEERA
jgi:hypothetical protein